jgi:hypothetical protein
MPRFIEEGKSLQWEMEYDGAKYEYNKHAELQ